MKSRLPISTILPNSATHFHEAWRRSPERELRTTSTPVPLVSRMTSGKKDELRELKMWFRGMSKVRIRYSTFSSVPTVVNICFGQQVGQLCTGEGSDLCANHATNVNGCNSDASASRLNQNSLCHTLAREQ
jgi:hypothetical protein